VISQSGWVSRSLGQGRCQPLRQVEAVGLDRSGQNRVGADQQKQASPPGDLAQPPPSIRRRPKRAEGPEHHGGAGRQALGDALGVGGPARDR
jgi:hypothetical protein